MNSPENPSSRRTSIQAFHLDMKQAQYRPDYLATLFPRLRDAGYNTILFEIENKVRLDSIGDATWMEAFTKAEFSAILDDCRRAGLQAIPLIQTYAHLEWLLTHSPFHALRELPNIAYTLCPLKPESRDFLQRCIDEVHELFGQPEFMHIGGDEATYMGTCPDCTTIVEADGKGTLYARHMSEMASQVLRRGARPLLWADMVLAHPECLTHFPKEVVWVDWHYEMTPETSEKIYLWGQKGRPAPSETSEAFRKNYGAYFQHPTENHYRSWFYADYLLDQGFDVLLAPAASCAGSHAFLPSFERAANVASASLKLRDEPRLLGQIVTSWAMRLVPLEAQWPLLRLPAAIQARPDDWSAALETASEQSFGGPIPDFLTHWKTLGQSFWWGESHHGFDWEIGYVGHPASIPLLFARWTADGNLNLPEEIAKTESLLSEYAAAARQLTPFLDQADPNNLCAQAWKIGIEAVQLRAREYRIYLQAQNGQIKKEAAAEVLQLSQIQSDQWQNFLLRMYQPAGVLLMHTILYAETKRLLPKISWGRFEKLTLPQKETEPNG